MDLILNKIVTNKNDLKLIYRLQEEIGMINKFAIEWCKIMNNHSSDNSVLNECIFKLLEADKILDLYFGKVDLTMYSDEVNNLASTYVINCWNFHDVLNEKLCRTLKHWDLFLDVAVKNYNGLPLFILEITPYELYLFDFPVDDWNEDRQKVLVSRNGDIILEDNYQSTAYNTWFDLNMDFKEVINELREESIEMMEYGIPCGSKVVSIPVGATKKLIECTGIAWHEIDDCLHDQFNIHWFEPWELDDTELEENTGEIEEITGEVE